MPLRSLTVVFTVCCLIVTSGDRPLARSDEPVATADAAQGKPAKHTNRLAKESSPYLLLHAHNPVDWYPWGEEALAKARDEKKLIFLSVGYSSCYWCHVMERESFMDDEIAALLNKHFVCIKVDREERPDIDEIYMQALHIYLQLIGSKQGGGWPLSMFLTPDTKPLMGGTYFPPRDKEGRVGFLSVLNRVQEAWTAEPAKWQVTGDGLAKYVAESLQQRPILQVVKPSRAMLDRVLSALAAQFDEQYGGFGFDPGNPRRAKFPEPPNLNFLLDQTRRKGDAADKMLAITLAHVADGGIRDHVGGGFHRYSTDRYWRVPHFEKMLYDNGQLVSVYSQAYEISPKPEYQHVVDEAIAFVLRELADPAGGFYAALDAETDGEEGKFYVWQREEIEGALSPEEYSLFAEVYGIADEPNFEGHYIPLLKKPLADVAADRKQTEAELDAALRPIRAKLLAERAKRPRPLTDTKILAGWNGLMIRGLADAGRVFKNDAYTQAAVRAAEFVLTKMRDAEGRLQRSYAGGQARLPAYLDDYALLVDGLLALHRATGDERWLKAGEDLTAQQIELFWDERVGGFFYTSTLHEQLIARSKLPTDGVIPSGNSVSTANLLYLAAKLSKPEYVQRAEQCIRSAAPLLEENPAAVVQLAVAVATFIEQQKPPVPQPAKNP